MRTRLRFLAGIAVTCAMAVAWSARVHQDVAAQARKPIKITRIYTGSDGRTHAEETQLVLKPGGSSAEQSDTIAVDSLRFSRTPPNHFSDWHNASRRQYVVTLSGRGQVELEDGKKIPLDPEHILLAEDVTGKGHITRDVGREERITRSLRWRNSGRVANEVRRDRPRDAADPARWCPSRADVRRHGALQPCSDVPLLYELMTTDMKAAETFYRAVVGWTSAPFEGSPQPCTVFKRSGEIPVAGVMARPEGMNASPFWAIYVGVPKLEAAAAPEAEMVDRAPSIFATASLA